MYSSSCSSGRNRDIQKKAVIEKRLDILPVAFMVFVSRFDIFRKNRNIYHAHTVLTDEGLGYELVDNGVSEVYVNTAVKDGSTLSELMGCFEQEKVDNAKFPNLTKEVKYYKENEKGVSRMCQIVEEYAQEKPQ